MLGRLFVGVAPHKHVGEGSDVRFGLRDRPRTRVHHLEDSGWGGKGGKGGGNEGVPKMVLRHSIFSRVVSSFFGIGILLASDLLGFRYFSRYCCTVSSGGNTFLRICGNSSFHKIERI